MSSQTKLAHEGSLELEPIAGASPEGGVFNIIEDGQVPGIGVSTLVDSQPEFVHGDITGRDHSRYLVGLDDHQHSILVTDAEAQYTEEDFYFFPGFTQTTDTPGGIGYKFHTELARRHPEARVFSVASTGIGTLGDRVRHDPSLATVPAMAEQRLRLMQALSGDRPKRLITLSMGTVIGNRALQMDLANGQKLNVVSSIKYEPAQVDPKRVPVDMFFKFPILMLPDALRELFDMRNISRPLRLVAHARALGKIGLCFEDVPALLNQMKSLSEGTPTEQTELETANYRVEVIAGKRDPLAQEPMWREQQDRHPGNVGLKFVPGRGHGMAADPVGGASCVSHVIKAARQAA